MGSSRGCDLASPRLDGRVVVADEVSVKVPRASVALSTASVYPESTATAFELAARLGYDGVEVMVSSDGVSQEVASLQRLSDYYEVPIVAIHSPCLLITQRVWGTEPWGKLQTAQRTAEPSHRPKLERQVSSTVPLTGGTRESGTRLRRSSRKPGGRLMTRVSAAARLPASVRERMGGSGRAPH